MPDLINYMLTDHLSQPFILSAFCLLVGQVLKLKQSALNPHASFEPTESRKVAGVGKLNHW